jgi:hypothetical protein
MNLLLRGTTSILEKNHAKSMQDFMQKIGRHRELWGDRKARHNRNV